LTRHILEQTRRNSDDLAAIKTRLDRVEGKVDGVAQNVRGVKATVDGLVRSLPTMISDAMRVGQARQVAGDRGKSTHSRRRGSNRVSMFNTDGG